VQEIEVQVAIPNTEEFIRWYHRIGESRIVWDEVKLSIRSVRADETSVAYRVELRRPSSPPYDIRSFHGKIWWPLFVGPQALSVERFMATVGDPDGCFLATMNLSPATLNAPREFTRTRFDEDYTIREITASTRDRRLTLAHRSAFRLLFCNGSVYQEGGAPAYFGTSSDKPDVATLPLRIGSLRIGIDQPVGRWYLVLSAAQRRRAALRSLVFHIDEIDEACIALKREGLVPVLEETAAVIGGATRELNAAKVCADALARAILTPRTRMPDRYHKAMKEFTKLAAADGTIPAEYSRKIINEGLEGMSPEAIRKCFGVELEWACKTADRLDRLLPYPPLSPIDAEALAQFAT
jgi:hypothetical protein